MVANLDQSKYEVLPIELNSKRDLIDKSAGIDVALLALHGKYGEDGTVQGTLESSVSLYWMRRACQQRMYG